MDYIGGNKQLITFPCLICMIALSVLLGDVMKPLSVHIYSSTIIMHPLDALRQQANTVFNKTLMVPVNPDNIQLSDYLNKTIQQNV